MDEADLRTRFPRVRTTAKAATTQIRIIDAYLHLMETNDYDKVMVSSIVEEAGITRSTFYAYFTDTFDLLEYVEGEMVANLPMPEKSELGKKPFSPSRPPDAIQCAQPAWIREWFEQAVYFSYQLSVLLGPTGNPQFAHKMRKKIREAHRRQMRHDGFDTDKGEDWLLKGLSDYHLRLTRELVNECRACGSDGPEAGELISRVEYFLNTLRVGSWYMEYLSLSDSGSLTSEGEHD